MKKRILLISLMIIILTAILTLTATGAIASIDFPDASPPSSRPNSVCGEPSKANAFACKQIEEQILKSTVRIRIDTWVVKADESGYEIDSKSSHATLKDGRYLVTHNHFTAPITNLPPGGESPAYASVTLSNSQGQALFNGPLSDFKLIWEDPETLVIAHKDNGLIESLGFVSAEFEAWSSLPLEAGMEVAQVDWDGVTTRVDWTTVQEVNVQDSVLQMVLADDVTLGASGGGIFWQGVHIANNWLQVQQLEESGALIDSITKVALNSTQVAGDTVKLPTS